MSAPEDLESLRSRIEAIDRELLGLISQRMDLAEAIAATKLSRAHPFRDPRREDELLVRVRKIATEAGLDPHRIERVFQLLMDMSVERQQQHIHDLPTAPLRVAYQGVEGAYSHLAAQRRFSGRPGGVLLEGFETFFQAAEAVRSGASDLALLPIENTTAGTIYETYDILADTGMVITGEIVTAIEHALVGIAGARVENVRRVISHPQALRQCATFLQSIPWATAEADFNTAGAARKVSEMKDPTVAAIASESAAQRYGLTVLQPIVVPGNFTRFVEIAREARPCAADAECKTSLLLILSHQPGALAAVLDLLAERRINLTKLESRPLAGSPFRYRFYLDLTGHSASRAVAEALEAIAPLTREMRVIGTYPQSDLPFDRPHL